MGNKRQFTYGKCTPAQQLSSPQARRHPSSTFLSYPRSWPQCYPLPPRWRIMETTKSMLDSFQRPPPPQCPDCDCDGESASLGFHPSGHAKSCEARNDRLMKHLCLGREQPHRRNPRSQPAASHISHHRHPVDAACGRHATRHNPSPVA